MNKDYCQELTDVSAGWTIDKWDGFAEQGEAFRLIISKDKDKKVLTVIATDIGFGLDSVHTIDDKGRELWSDLWEMAYEISNHPNRKHDVAFGADITDIIEVDSDVYKLLVGYRCKMCGKEWWITLHDIRKSEHKKLFKAMLLPETRHLIYNDDYLFGCDEEIEE